MNNFYKNKKVLVTGHTGFKGSYMCEALCSFGAEVVGYALEPQEKENLFDILKLRGRVKSCIADIRCFNDLSACVIKEQPDIIFHMAAQPLVRDSYERPVYTYETNVMGTVNMLESIRGLERKVSFVNVTTDKVYRNNEWERGYKEEDELCGFDPYSNSKSCSELVTFSYNSSFFANSNVIISTARSGNVIGGGDFAKDRIIPDCVKAAINNQDIVVRNPHSTRPYQHVLDCLSGYLLLAQKQYEDARFAGAYNFGPYDSDCLTTGKLVDLFCKTWGEGQKWQNKHDGGPHEANFLKLDWTKAKDVLSWLPKYKIEDAVIKTVEWAKMYEAKGDIAQFTKKQIKEYFEVI